jgi:hypothetical protein
MRNKKISWNVRGRDGKKDGEISNEEISRNLRGREGKNDGER